MYVFNTKFCLMQKVGSENSHPAADPIRDVRNYRRRKCIKICFFKNIKIEAWKLWPIKNCSILEKKISKNFFQTKHAILIDTKQLGIKESFKKILKSWENSAGIIIISLFCVMPV
jgi:hypothetical protein